MSCLSVCNQDVDIYDRTRNIFCPTFFCTLPIELEIRLLKNIIILSGMTVTYLQVNNEICAANAVQRIRTFVIFFVMFHCKRQSSYKCCWFYVKCLYSFTCIYINGKSKAILLSLCM